MIWLFSENINIKQIFWSLIDKILKLFKILIYYSYLYRLDFPEFIKNYRIFNIKVLKKDSNNPLFG